MCSSLSCWRTRSLKMEEVLDLQYKDLKVIQDPDGYCFTSDSVLLANYVKSKPQDIVVEFCAGCGVISILLSGKQKMSKIYSFELQRSLFDMFEKSVKLNNLQDKIQPINDKLENVTEYLSYEGADVVFCNPPYHEGGDKSGKDQIALATHEVETSLESIIKSVNKVLKYGGKFFMVHRVDRMVDVLTKLREHKIEPKKITIIYPKKDSEPVVFLLTAIKGGKKGLRMSRVVYADEFNKSCNLFD